MSKNCLCGVTTSYANIARHKKICKALPIIIKLNEKIENLEKTIQKKQNEILILHKEIEIKEAKSPDLFYKHNKIQEKDFLEILQEKDTRIINLQQDLLKEKNKIKTQINNTYNNININICPFGKEKLPEKSAVKPLFYFPSESVPNYIKLKHFNEIGAGNIRILNERGKFLQVVELDQTGRKRWVKRDKSKTLSDITESNIDELVEVFGADKIALWKQWYIASGLNKNGFEKTSAWRNLLKNVELVILNAN